MRPLRTLDDSFGFMGGRVPVAIGGLIGLTLAASVIGAVGDRNGLPIRLMGILSPAAVWGGQVWRLATWVFFEADGIALLFGCLSLWWFGRDLCYAWGAKRFLAVYLGFAVTSAGVTCLIARFLWPELMSPRLGYLGTWPLVDAILIAWAVRFPHRQMLQYFVIPIGGRNLIYFTIGLTLVFALLNGLFLFVPHFVAIALMLAYVRDSSLHSLWLRLKLRALQYAPRRRTSRLRPVERDDLDKPPRWLH